MSSTAGAGAKGADRATDATHSRSDRTRGAIGYAVNARRRADTASRRRRRAFPGRQSTVYPGVRIGYASERRVHESCLTRIAEKPYAKLLQAPSPPFQLSDVTTGGQRSSLAGRKIGCETAARSIQIRHQFGRCCISMTATR